MVSASIEAVIVQFETTNRHHSEFLSHEVFLDHENKIYYHSFHIEFFEYPQLDEIHNPTIESVYF